MAGVAGKSGRHKRADDRASENLEGLFLRLRSEILKKVWACKGALEHHEGVSLSKAEAVERILEAGCEALERTLEGSETPATISEISEISKGIPALHELAKPVYLIDEGIPFDEDLAPASPTNGTRAPAPQPPTQPAIPLALEPVIEAPAPMLQTPYAPPGMQNCTAGLHHPPYPVSAKACPLCRRNQRARERKTALASAPEAPAAPIPATSHNGNAVIQENAPRRPGRPSTMRQPIIDLLRQHPEGLTAIQIKVHLGIDKNIGDTLAGMVRDHVIEKKGSGKDVRYLAVTAEGMDTRVRSKAKPQATSKSR